MQMFSDNAKSYMQLSGLALTLTNIDPKFCNTSRGQKYRRRLDDSHVDLLSDHHLWGVSSIPGR